MTVTYCGDSFCVPQKSSIDVTCHDLGKEAGKWIMYNYQGKTCYCICSCMAEGTRVTTGNGSQIKVEDMVQGSTTVLAAGINLRFTSQVANSVVKTSTGDTKNSIYLEYSLNGQKIKRVVTMDHPFLLYNKKLVGAGALQMNDQLIDQNGNPVSISRISWGTYVGKFWEFATNLNVPDQNYTNHLVITEGVVTGDYAVSIYENYPVDSSELAQKGDPARPFIGSAEWRELNGHDPRHLPEGPVQFEDGLFLPASLHEEDIPENVSAFLPENQAIILEERAPKEPLSNQNILDMCEYLIEFVFEPHYPDIKFLFNWYDDRVNSYSWVDSITKDQYVYLSGELARVVGFDIEGVTMALAHEVGHLMGKPKLENGVTCEGQADWFAGSVVLRTIWFGEEYFTKTNKAIQQLRVLYGYLLECEEDEDTDAPEEDDYGQPYPSNSCRIQTYKTAMTSPTPPACSLCDIEDEDYGDDDDDEYDIADGFDAFEDEDNDDYEDDEDYEDEDYEDEDGIYTGPPKIPGARDRQQKKKGKKRPKSPGARDRQQRKKARLLGDEEENVFAKAPGARDRQRRKKRRFEGDVGLPTAKISGARDRQQKKKRAEDEDDVFAKAPGARDRQRRKKRTFEGDFGSDGIGSPDAKVSGARDRARKKKRRFELPGNEVLAKAPGARDRQRRKKR